ncbi:MAG: OmpA family protein [Kofleriaceae bacterium]
MKRALALLCVVAACAGQQVRTQTTATDGLIATARENGAQRCAPVELAMAESNNDFAQHELDEGNYHEAKELAGIAERNAQLAIEKSPKDKCTAGPVVAGPGDTDGDGILDPKDSCPRVPEDFDGFQDEDGCPEEDNDADGINDKIDACPNDPEDRDSFEDDDGCPELDNDKDGIADKIDACPSDPEDKDNFEDDDGCPDPDNDKDGIPDLSDKCPNEPGVPPDGCPKKYNLVVVTEKKIEIKQTVYFDTNKATIKRVSFPLLNEVAQALKDNPKIEVEVQGHTDSQGNDNFNMKLSQNRANSVRAYLMKQGVDASRMTAVGYGENVMIADNRTAEGRAQNRRVEFIITKR